MKKCFFKYLFWVSLISIGVIYGILFCKFKIFPYDSLRKVYHSIQTQEKEDVYGQWSIGVYAGSTLFNLTDPDNIINPILTGKDVVDIDAVFVADPFMITKNKKHFLFFEVLNRKTDQGDIAYAESSNLIKWNYKKVIIDEKFHLSYPHIFEWNKEYCLIPESYQDYSVRLYRATKFPERWEYLGNLLTGYHYVDPTIFRFENKWWLFVTTPENEVLNLYFSDDLHKGWKPHPMNPIIKFDRHISRPAGRVVIFENKLYRLAQDDDPSYGVQVFAFEIIDISETTYSEKPTSQKPVVSKTGMGWNAAGMHHLDLHKIDNKWIGFVDGRNR